MSLDFTLRHRIKINQHEGGNHGLFNWCQGKDTEICKKFEVDWETTGVIIEDYLLHDSVLINSTVQVSLRKKTVQKRDMRHIQNLRLLQGHLTKQCLYNQQLDILNIEFLSHLFCFPDFAESNILLFYIKKKIIKK